MLTNGKKLKFCTSHGKTLKDICKSQLTDLNVDIRSTIFYNVSDGVWGSLPSGARGRTVEGF